MSFWTWLFGGSTKAPTVDGYSIVSAMDIGDEFHDVRNISIVDATYAVATLAWYKATLYPYMVSQLNASGIFQWKEKFDCDNWSASFCYWARVCHACSKMPGSVAEGMGCGQVSYLKNGTDGHSIVAVYTEQGLIFIEPQTGAVLILSAEERASIFGIEF